MCWRARVLTDQKKLSRPLELFQLIFGLQRGSLWLRRHWILGGIFQPIMTAASANVSTPRRGPTKINIPALLFED